MAFAQLGNELLNTKKEEEEEEEEEGVQASGRVTDRDSCKNF